MNLFEDVTEFLFCGLKAPLVFLDPKSEKVPGHLVEYITDNVMVIILLLTEVATYPSENIDQST